VPLSALFHRNGRPAVWVVEGDRVRLQEIATGELQANSVAVTAGLEAGQRIVTAGVNRLSDGQRVALAAPPSLLARQP
jgi:hypothetical protein